MNSMFRRTLLLAAVSSALASTAAMAATWVSTPPNASGMTELYDVDSVYMKASTRMIYVTTCDDVKCTTSSPGELFGPTATLVNCADRSVSYAQGDGWGAPAHESKTSVAMNDDEYAPGTSAAMTVDAMCARENSWPKRP